MYLLVELGRIRQHQYLQIQLLGPADPQDSGHGFLHRVGSMRQLNDYWMHSTRVGREMITGSVRQLNIYSVYGTCVGREMIIGSVRQLNNHRDMSGSQ